MAQGHHGTVGEGGKGGRGDSEESEKYGRACQKRVETATLLWIIVFWRGRGAGGLGREEESEQDGEEKGVCGDVEIIVEDGVNGEGA